MSSKTRAVFYAAAGVRLAKLKERMPPGEKWPAYVKAKCGLRRSRADELIKYGLHEDDVEKMLERTRASVKKHRAAKAAVICNGNGRDKFLAFASKMIESAVYRGGSVDEEVAAAARRAAVAWTKLADELDAQISNQRC